ncbi:MAG: hypothetical protein AB7Q29_13735 [Vicinamibacterales bacterium]
MRITTLTQDDLRVRENVVRQLDWDPAFDGSGIGVSARGAVVTHKIVEALNREADEIC